MVVGHRGAAARAPENTAASLAAGVEAGADAIEIDVSLTRDGRAVLLHDATLDRTTTGRGPLRAKTFEEVAALDAGSWFASRFAGEPPIDLDDAIAVVRPRAHLVVEIKAIATARSGRLAASDRRTVEAVVRAIERVGGPRGITVSSACWQAIDLLAELLPSVARALTVGFSERRDPVRWAARTGAAALHPNYRVCSSAFLARARSARLAVIPYTVNRPGLARRLVAAGADGVFTDDPAAMRRALLRAAPPPDALVLGIDQGSGGTRAVLLDPSGSIVASRAVAVASRRNRDGAIVQDAETIAASVARAAGPLLEHPPAPVLAAGLAVQRSSLVVWRRSDRKPVAPVQSWRTGTAYHPPAALLRVEERIRRATGLTPRYPYGAIRLAAASEADPELARGLASGRLVAGPLGAFLADRLGAGAAGPCDPSLAQRTLAFDVERGAFTAELAAALDVPASCWAEVFPSSGDRGSLRVGRRRVPFRALLGDVGAAARAVCGPLDDATAGALVLGTGGFVVVPTGRARCDVPGLLTTLLYEDAGGPIFAIEGTVHGLAAGLAAAGRFGGFEALPAPRIAARGAAADRAARVVAAVEGTGTPDWDVTPRFEVEPGRHSAAAIVRGAVEDLAKRFGAIAAILREHRALPPRFVTTGGLAAPHLTARIAARLGVPLDLDPLPDRTAAGAALLARDAL